MSLKKYSRTGRALAAGVAATVAIAGASLIGGQSASAAPTQWTEKPTVQAAGNFLDVTVGDSTLDPLLKLAFARADYDGSSVVTTDQNPLDIKVLNAIELPLTGALQLPGLLGIKLGAVYQVAKAQPDGFSYGASGAVLNSGAVSIGGDNNAFPADATIDLSPSGIMGASGAALDALGHVRVSINGLSALAQTPVGFNKGATTDYRIADIKLDIGSPMLGQLLGPVIKGLTDLLGGLAAPVAKAGASMPTTCAGLGSDTFVLAAGAITIDPANANLTISLQKILEALHLDLNNLPPNTDLVGYLLNYITDADGLIGGLINTVTNLVGSCGSSLTSSLNGIPVLGDLLKMLNNGLNTTTKSLDQITAKLAAPTGIGAQISSLLKPLLAIGVNVQPMGPKGSFETKFKENLPKQGMTPPAKPYTALVRALEIDLLGGALTVGLANAAAGPSFPGKAVEATTATPSPSPSKGVAGVTAGPPTAIPAGQGGTGGTPVAPIVLLLVGLMMASGGALAWKLRGRHVV
jgi:hypothetical protein